VLLLGVVVTGKRKPDKISRAPKPCRRPSATSRSGTRSRCRNRPRRARIVARGRAMALRRVCRVIVLWVLSVATTDAKYGIASVKVPLAMRSALGAVSAELSERRYWDPAGCGLAKRWRLRRWPRQSPSWWIPCSFDSFGSPRAWAAQGVHPRVSRDPRLPSATSEGRARASVLGLRLSAGGNPAGRPTGAPAGKPPVGTDRRHLTVAGRLPGENGLLGPD
jgi:hypothetical protein